MRCTIIRFRHVDSAKLNWKHLQVLEAREADSGVFTCVVPGGGGEGGGEGGGGAAAQRTVRLVIFSRGDLAVTSAGAGQSPGPRCCKEITFLISLLYIVKQIWLL